MKQKKQNKIYIVRHGETVMNKIDLYQGTLDSSLTEKGLEHAENIARFLEKEEIDYLFSSPLNRAQMTANIITQRIGLPINTIPEFHEMYYGDLQGKKKEDFEGLYKTFFEQRLHNAHYKAYTPYPNGESYIDVHKRVFNKMIFLIEQYQNFIIVGHESLNRVLRGIIHNIPVEKMVNVRQKNNEVIVIRLDDYTEEVYIV